MVRVADSFSDIKQELDFAYQKPLRISGVLVIAA